MQQSLLKKPQFTFTHENFQYNDCCPIEVEQKAYGLKIELKQNMEIEDTVFIIKINDIKKGEISNQNRRLNIQLQFKEGEKKIYNVLIRKQRKSRESYQRFKDKCFLNIKSILAIIIAIAIFFLIRKT